MPPDQMQAPTEDIHATTEMPMEMTDDDVAAALGYITTLTEQAIPQDPMPDAQTGGSEMEEIPMEEQEPAAPSQDMEGMKEEIITAIREEMVTDEMRKEFEEIKAKLDELAKEDNDEGESNEN